jgi:hypothetical protein
VFCLYVIDMRMASSTNAIMRSVVPSVAWCLDDDSFSAVPKCAWNAVQNLLVNLLSLSDTISRAIGIVLLPMYIPT